MSEQHADLAAVLLPAEPLEHLCHHDPARADVLVAGDQLRRATLSREGWPFRKSTHADVSTRTLNDAWAPAF